MSCAHPRPNGEDDPTAIHGVKDLARPYEAATGGWTLADGGSYELVLLRADAWASRLSADRPAKPTLMLDDGVTIMVPRLDQIPPLSATAATDSGAGVAALCVKFELRPPAAGASGAAAYPPASMYARVPPSLLCAERLGACMWAAELVDCGAQPAQPGSSQRRAPASCKCRLILLLPESSGVAAAAESESGEIVLTLEPTANDHGFSSGAVPSRTIRVSGIR